MTEHWAFKYVGRRWEENRNCGYWFAEIVKENFGYEVKYCEGGHKTTRAAVQALNCDVTERYGYRETPAPKEGDAVFLSQRTRTHHIGMVIFIGGKLQILHALQGVGLVLSSRADLTLNGWKITGFWEYAGIQEL